MCKLPLTGEILEKRQDDNLEKWATKNADIEGSYADYIGIFEETYRTRFRRDKDRILYTKSIRHLQYKTQVIANDAGDDQRTRLLHTLEVQQIAGSVADAILANTDLVEAIALGHDLGHTPFGHAAERVLNQLLKRKKAGGFSHAIQSVRILRVLQKHPKLPSGLGISKNVLEGILKHDTDTIIEEFSDDQIKQCDCMDLHPNRIGSIESQIVYWADKIAYLSHDWEDFIQYCYSDIFEYKDQLNNEFKNVQLAWGTILNKKIENIDLKKIETRDIIRCVVKNLIETSKAQLQKLKEEISDVNSDFIIEYVNNTFSSELKKSENRDKKAIKKCYQNSLIINLDKEFLKAFQDVRDFLDDFYIKGPIVNKMDKQAEMVVKFLFSYYYKNPESLPWGERLMIAEQNDKLKIEFDKRLLSNEKRASLIAEEESKIKARIVADYIANMTDRFALKEYNQIKANRRGFY